MSKYNKLFPKKLSSISKCDIKHRVMPSLSNDKPKLRFANEEHMTKELAYAAVFCETPEIYRTIITKDITQ